MPNFFFKILAGYFGYGIGLFKVGPELGKNLVKANPYRNRYPYLTLNGGTDFFVCTWWARTGST